MPWSETDVRGMLEAFGRTVQVKGADYLALVQRNYEQANLGGRFIVESSAPVFVFATSDADALELVDDDVIGFGDVNFSITEVAAGDEGWTEVRATL